MPDAELLRDSYVIRQIQQADPREFTLFLGAGASWSSGIPVGSDMIKEWRTMACGDMAPSGADPEKWCENQGWYGKDDEYSVLFEMLFPNERARQNYVTEKIEHKAPTWCYLYLADVINDGKINVVFTTNFDDLVNEALTRYLGYNAVVCAADSEAESISLITSRAKIIKLHGDYLFKKLKNTKEELKELDPNMQQKFVQFGKECGMVVIGYAGRDESVMSVLESLLQDSASFPNGVYWGVRPPVKDVASRVQELATKYPRRFKLFECSDFDLFMSNLHKTLDLNLPNTVLQPYEALRESFTPLINVGAQHREDPVMMQHIAKLEQELGRSWAQADRGEFDLLEAQMALGKRDYEKAIELASTFCQKKPEDANGLTTWADALAMKGEEKQSPDALNEAAEKWKEAIRVDPTALMPRYSLARYYTRTQQKKEAIPISEELLKRVPNDHALRRNLVTLYGSGGQLDKALEHVNWLLQREPDAADLHAMKAAVLEQRGLISEALKEKQEAVRLDSQNASYHFVLANAYVTMGRFDEAASEFNGAIELEPNTLSYRLQVANFYWMRAQPAMALPNIEAAVRIEPDSAEAHGWLGQIYMAVGRPIDAQRETEAALKLSPEDSRLLGNAGFIYMQLNRLDLAEQYLVRAVQLNPTTPQPFMMLSVLYWRLYRDQDLQGALQRLSQLAPPIAQQVQMQLQAATMQFGGNREKAVQAMQNQSGPVMPQQAPPPQQPRGWGQPPQPQQPWGQQPYAPPQAWGPPQSGPEQPAAGDFWNAFLANLTGRHS
jgi:tetratricopeptide (TPR) repeat protein